MRKQTMLFLISWVIFCTSIFFLTEKSMTASIIGISLKTNQIQPVAIFFILISTIAVIISRIMIERNQNSIDEAVNSDDTITSVVETDNINRYKASHQNNYLILDTCAFIDLYKEICSTHNMDKSTQHSNIKHHPLYIFLNSESDKYKIILTSEVKMELENQTNIKRLGDDGEMITPPIILNTLYTLMGEGKITEVNVDADSDDREEIKKLNETSYKSGEHPNTRIGEGDISIAATVKLFGSDKDTSFRVISRDSDVRRLMDAYNKKHGINVSCQNSINPFE